METGGLDNADVVAWICFGLGVLVLLAGLYGGLKTAPEKAGAEKQEKVEEARRNLETTTTQLREVTSSKLESGVAAGKTATATAAAEAAKSALDQIGTIVGSLPEHQRFPGMLVLVGAVLMSVGTVQFGGTSIF